MALTMRRIPGVRRALPALVAVFLLGSAGACKSSPPHTDSIKGTTKSDRDDGRDSGMHDGQM
jgi:hypothetical protein